jgi:aspartyl protease family protein
MRRPAWLFGLLAGVLIHSACAQGAPSVSLSGSMGDKALLIINGSPRTLAVGSTHQGIKLLSMAAGEAVVEMDGKRVKLLLGGAQVNLGGGATGDSASQIVLTAGPGGHFITNGSINGKSVRFMVDTGATTVAMSQADAERIGLNYRNGQTAYVRTANGQVSVHRVTLSSVRINGVQVYDVDATVLPSQMDFVLLGNSYLTRFQMKRENDRMTLDKR